MNVRISRKNQICPSLYYSHDLTKNSKLYKIQKILTEKKLQHGLTKRFFETFYSSVQVYTVRCVYHLIDRKFNTRKIINFSSKPYFRVKSTTGVQQTLILMVNCGVPPGWMHPTTTFPAGVS